MGRIACTESQSLYNGALYLYLHLKSPCGPYSLYRASVPVQRCTLPLPIPLHPPLTVVPVQNISACTTVHFNFTINSSLPMGRTVCTEPSETVQSCTLNLHINPFPMGRTACTVPQCLYKGVP